jgi:hypothetical protein
LTENRCFPLSQRTGADHIKPQKTLEMPRHGRFTVPGLPPYVGKMGRSLLRATTPGSSVPIRPILHLRPFSATAASHDCQGLSGGPGNGVHGVAAGDVRANGNLIAQYVRNPVSPCQTQINVTMPHRAIKRMVRAMLGFKAFGSAAITIAGIEIMHMIRKGQLRSTEKLRPAQQFYSLAG